MKRFTEDCTGRNADRCVALGVSYEKGSGVPQDKRRAAALYDQACKGGLEQGCSVLNTF